MLLLPITLIFNILFSPIKYSMILTFVNHTPIFLNRSIMTLCISSVWQCLHYQPLRYGLNIYIYISSTPFSGLLYYLTLTEYNLIRISLVWCTWYAHSPLYIGVSVLGVFFLVIKINNFLSSNLFACYDLPIHVFG